MGELKPNIADPKFNTVSIANFVGSDHDHDLETKRFVIGLLMLLNKNTINWYRKSQNTVETLTYV